MATGAYSVRRATRQDAEVIRSIHEAGWRAGYAHLYEPEVLERAVQKHCSRWSRVLGDPAFKHTTLLVLEVEGKVIGFAHFGPSGNELSSEQEPGRTELYSFYVHPDQWGTTAASCLIRHVVDAVAAQGQDELYLTTGEGVSRARRFYEKSGFLETGTTSVYNLLGEVPTPELQYVLKISADR